MNDSVNPNVNSNASNSDEFEIDLSSLSRYIKEGARRFFLLLPIIMAVVIVCGCLIENYTYSPKYSSQVTIAVNPPDDYSYDDGKGTRISNYSSATATQLAQAFTQVVNSSLFSDKIAEHLGESTLKASLSAALLGDESNYITVTVSSTGGDPTYPEKVLDAIDPVFHDVCEGTLGDVDVEIFPSQGDSSLPVNSLSLPKMIIKYAAISVFVWLVVLVIYSITRNRILSRDDVKTKLGISSIAAALPNTFARDDGRKTGIELTAKHINPIFVESVKLLAAKIDRNAGESGGTFVITSSIAGEGKTTISANVAAALAMRGRKVVLVDGDLRLQTIKEKLGITKPTRGLKDINDGKVVKEQILYTSPKIPFTVISGDETTNSPIKFINSKRVKGFLGYLRKQFDIVIIDTPPCALLSDANTFAKFSNGVYFVIREDWADVKTIEKALRSLKSSSTEILGVVLNNSSASFSSGAYGYGRYGHYGRYGKYGRKYGRYGYGKYGKYGKYGRYGSYGAYGAYGAENNTEPESEEDDK